MQPQVDAVGADRLIQHAVERHLVLAIQPQGHGQNGLAARIQQGDDVAVDLIVGRLAAAGEAIQAGLARLEVERHQAITAHAHRQLAIQTLARPLPQGDPAVVAKVRIGGIGDHRRGAAGNHAAIAVGHLHRQT